MAKFDMESASNLFKTRFMRLMKKVGEARDPEATKRAARLAQEVLKMKQKKRSE